MFWKKKKPTSELYLNNNLVNSEINIQNETNEVEVSNVTLRDSTVNIFGSHNNISFNEAKALEKINIEIHGDSNTIILDRTSIFSNVKLFVRGNNHKITLGDCKFLGGVIWVESEGCEITLGDDSTFEQVGLIAPEPFTKIIIGKDCMLSHNVTIRTSDSHPIYDMESDVRINMSMDVIVEDHVWIGAYSHVLKGVRLSEGSAIGLNTTVTKDVPKNSVAVGQPAKVVREGVYWKREPIREFGDELKIQQTLKRKYYKE